MGIKNKKITLKNSLTISGEKEENSIKLNSH